MTTLNWPNAGRILTTWLLILTLAGCAPTALRSEFESVNEYYRTHDKAEFQFDEHGTLNLRYVETGDPDKPTVVFVHGTPGSWMFFSSYLNDQSLQRDAHLIAIDRPGWGGSTLADGDFEPEIEGQSQLSREWLCELSAASGTGELILVGHSLGGTLAPRLAMDHPDCVTAVLILAAPMDPDLSAPRWYNHLARIPPFGWLADKMLGGGMRQSNKEMMILRSELEKMRPLWANLTIPVIVIQGGKDGLVNPDHADFAEKMLPGKNLKTIRLPDDDHFFLFTNRALVHEQIRSLLDFTAARSALGNVDSKPAL